MEEKILALETIRAEKYKKYLNLTLVGAFFLVLGIIFVALAWYLASFLFFIPAIILISIAQGERVKFVKKFKNQLIIQLLEGMYEVPSYNERGSIPQQVINQTRLVKKPDRFYGEDYITGKYKNVSFEVCDVRMEEVRVSSNGKTTQTHYVTYFQGRWMIFKLNRNFKEELRIVEKGLYNSGHSGSKLVKVETESIEFNKKFIVRASSEQYAFYQITPSMLEKLHELERLFKGHISFLFRNDELHIAINDRKNSLEPKFSEKLTTESIKKHLFEIDIMASIINEFRLDSAKFQEQKQ